MNGRGWSEADLLRLVDLYLLNMTYPDMAVALGRSEVACRSKVKDLRASGLIKGPVRIAGRKPRLMEIDAAETQARLAVSGKAKAGENFNITPMGDAEIKGIDFWSRAELMAADRMMSAAMAKVSGRFQDIQLRPSVKAPLQAGVLVQPGERRALP